MSPTVTPTLDKANTEQLAQGRGVLAGQRAVQIPASGCLSDWCTGFTPEGCRADSRPFP
jgi:hypothetical protein